LNTLDSFAPRYAQIMFGLAVGEVVGIFSATVKVDLMGGTGGSKLGSGWINYDLEASGLSGISDDVANFSKHFPQGSVSEIVANNPQTTFLSEVTPSLESGGTITVRGNMTNKYFKGIYNGKAEGLENYNVISRTENVPNKGYMKTGGNDPVTGKINEIILMKKTN